LDIVVLRNLRNSSESAENQPQKTNHLMSDSGPATLSTHVDGSLNARCEQSKLGMNRDDFSLRVIMPLDGQTRCEFKPHN
jgi:hypothetical protein